MMHLLVLMNVAHSSSRRCFRGRKPCSNSLRPLGRGGNQKGGGMWHENDGGRKEGSKERKCEEGNESDPGER